MIRLLARLRQSPPAPPRERLEPTVLLPGRPPLRVSLSALANSMAKPAQAQPKVNPFQLPRYPKGVLPGGRTELAMDEASTEIVASTWDFGSALHGLWAEGIGFMGYPYLAELSQRAEYRRASEVLAEEMTRKWIKLKATGEQDKTDKLQALGAALDQFRVRDVFREALEHDGFFGLAFLYLDFGGADEEELRTRLTVTPEKIGRGTLKAIRVVDPTWCAPNRYDARDPTSPTFYRPQSWFVMGREIHASRLLPIISRPLPDILKPAYNFGGLSLSQMMKPYVDNWLKTRESVSDLISAFTIFNLSMNLEGLLAGAGGAEENKRLEAMTLMRDNRGMLVTDKNTEELKNISAPLGTLDHLQAQAQEHIASVCAIPLVKLLGVTPSGLNASADGEIRTFYDGIKARQEKVCGDRIRTILQVLQLDAFGEIDPEIDYEFVPLWELDEAGAAGVRKTNADTDHVLVELGAIDPDEVRQRIAAEPDSPYAGLDLSKPAPGPPGGMEGGPGGEPGAGGEPGGMPPGGGQDTDPATAQALLEALAGHGMGDSLAEALLEALQIGGAGENVEEALLAALQGEQPAKDAGPIIAAALGGIGGLFREALLSHAAADGDPFTVAAFDAFREDQHKRDKGGQFSTTGGGGGREGRFAASGGSHGSLAGAVKGAAGHAAGAVKKFGQEDHEILREHFSKVSDKQRVSVSNNIVATAKSLPRLLASHWKEEAHNAVHAAGALKSLASGSKPTPEQFKGLRALTTKVVLSGAMMALTGDPTGAAAHGATAAAHGLSALAQEFGQEIVQHTIYEHAAKLFAGAGRTAASAFRRSKVGADRAPDGGQLGPEDMQLLQRWIEALGQAVREMTPEKAQATLDQGGGEGGGKESSARDSDPFIRALLGQDAAEFDESKVKRDDDGKFSSTGGGGGGAAEHKPVTRAFVSPSVADHLDFSQATAGLKEKRQKLLETTSREVDEALGLTSTNKGAIGAWSDGAENSIMTEMDGADWKTLRAAVAMKASLANQKAALIFQEAADDAAVPEGAVRGTLVNFEAKGTLDKIHQDLLEDGVAFHTVIPTEGGATVYAVDTDGTMVDAINKAAQRHGTVPEYQRGHAEFIGNNEGKGDTDQAQRHAARLAYKGIIERSGVEGAEAVWKRIRPTFEQAFEVSEFPVGATTEKLPGSKSQHPATIATRRPTAVGSVEGDEYRRADLEGMKADPKVFKANMDLLKDASAYPGLRPDEVEDKAPQEIARAAIDHAKKNLRFLYENAPKDVREEGHLWYEGAHNIAKTAAEKYGIPLASAAGVYAALSPQKLWDLNVKLGDRLLDIYHNQQDTAWDSKMDTTAARIWQPKDQALLDRVSGKKLSELELPAEKAMWIRTHDEANREQTFDRLSPDGRVLGDYYNLDGSLAKGGWQNLSAISNAITALESGGNRETISVSMGDRHKVRSFYNNILDPHSANNDVTMDTHAIGAALLTPSTSLSSSVSHSLATNPPKDKQPPGFKGASSSNKTGISGTYGLWADAYRELASELGIEPRVLQSVTWVAKRKLFDPRMTKATVKTVNGLWDDYHTGKADLAATQKAILKAAGGMDKPADGVPQPKASKA